jgi:hypothetical protein
MTKTNHLLIDRRAMLGLTASAATGAIAACGTAKAPAASSAAAKRRFDNKVVIVTGATSGIGRAAPLAFAAERGKVGFSGRRERRVPRGRPIPTPCLG